MSVVDVIQGMCCKKPCFDNADYKSRKRLTCRLSWFLQQILARSAESTGGADISCDLPFVLVFTAHPGPISDNIEAGAEIIGHAGIFSTSGHDVL